MGTRTRLLSVRQVRFAAALLPLLLFLATPCLAGYSPDDAPKQTAQDEGDVFLFDGSLEVDDGPCGPFPVLSPCLGVPSPDGFDLDAYSIEEGRAVCPQDPPPALPGILFSFDDGEPGAGSGPPNHQVELLFYDRCNVLGGGSFYTNADEPLLSLGTNPPPTADDDDVDAFESWDSAFQWDIGASVLFSPDTPKTGGLLPDPGCMGSRPEGHVYLSNSGVSAAFFSDPCRLGVPDIEDCDVDALVTVVGEEAEGVPPSNLQLLFSTDAAHPCGLDPGDIFLSDNAGHVGLWADDVHDLQIARGEDERVDLDALSVNADGPIEPGQPYDPPRPLTWKADWPDYAPSGMPDYSQYHASFPGGGTTYCGPTALADCLWWYDSEMEGRCGGAPGDGVDDHPLVEAYAAAGDDHESGNVPPFVQDLAAFVKTDLVVPGTRVDDMVQGVRNYIASKHRGQQYIVRKISSPRIDEIACEVERSEDVILLLGFWWSSDGGINWRRCGGHYVTSAGVHFDPHPGADGCPGFCGVDDDGDGGVDEPDELCPCRPGTSVFGDDRCAGIPEQIAFSDPGKNNAELPGFTGRVRGPFHANHAPLIPPDHDDAQNISHDLYDVGPTLLGAFAHALPNYGSSTPGGPTECALIDAWCGQNPDEDENPMAPCGPNDLVSVEIETMIDISPVMIPICLDVQPGINRLGVTKTASCPSPALHPMPYDYIRGEVCQLSEPATVDLGIVDCLSPNDPADQYLEERTWDITEGIGAWFFLVRQNPTVDYGASSAGNLRFPSAGDCP